MLTFIPTPIGNLADISYRSVLALQEAELILCEDTRVTKKLLQLLSDKFSLDFNTKQFKSLHSHNEQHFLTQENKSILINQNVVYVSDAGMPCVSDPGAYLVDFCIKNEIKYDVLPGANAVLIAYAMSGFTQKEFTFYGFLPHKSKDRISQLETILQSPFLTILYESPHRLIQLLEELSKLSPQREIFLAKELTKIYQDTFKSTASDIYTKLKNTQIRGEWVVIINSTQKTAGEPITISDIQTLDLAPKQKAKLLSKLTGESVKNIYNNFSK